FGVPENRLDRAFDVACFPILILGSVLALALSLAVHLPLLQHAVKRQELTGSLSEPEVVAAVVQAQGFLEVVRKYQSDRFLEGRDGGGGGPRIQYLVRIKRTNPLPRFGNALAGSRRPALLDLEFRLFSGLGALAFEFLHLLKGMIQVPQTVLYEPVT